jgi:hypothetical protein
MKRIDLLRFGAGGASGNVRGQRLSIDKFGACLGVAKRMEECVHYSNGEFPKLGLNVGK